MSSSTLDERVARTDPLRAGGSTMYTFTMTSGNGRRPRTFVFMAAAAYLTVIGVGVSLFLRGSGAPESPAPTIILTLLVLLFGLTAPIGERPWARTPRSLTATAIFDFALLVALLFLAPSPWLPAILFFVLIPVSSRLRSPTRYVVYAAAPTVVLAAIAARGHLAVEWTSLASLVPGFIAVMVFSESYRAVRDSSQESRKLLDELVRAQEQLREVAVVEERQRLAQEMHDAVGHRLAVASIQLEAVCKLIESDPARAVELASVSRDQVRAGLTELRSAVSSLSASEIEPRSLRLRIEETVEVFRKGSSIEVATDLDPGADDLDTSRAIVLLRCVQEGLTNVQRHSNATQVRVTLSVHKDDEGIEMIVEDNGSGESCAANCAREAPGGFGLRSLRERAEAIGGSVDFTRGDARSRLAVKLLGSRS